MSKISSMIRSVILAAVVIVAAFLCGIKLLRIQVVDGQKYLLLTKETYTSTLEIDAARGQIVDCDGKVLNTNKIIYNVNLLHSSLDEGTENEVIYRLLTVLQKNGEEWNDSLPITKTEPYAFESGRENAVETLKSKLNIASYSTVENCVYWLYKTYDISDKYDEKMRRAIAGVRYEMTLKDFSSVNNKFVLASDIGVDTVQELKELSGMLRGMDISESWERQYAEGDIASHLRGTVGAISAEQYLKLKDEGYTLNDIIGLSGIEKALEDELRGTRGERTITIGQGGAELSDEVTKKPVAGNSVMTTIDYDYQKLIQQALEYHVKYLQSPYYNKAYADPEVAKKYACQSGAVVVLDTKTGGVLAAASYPNYDINDYVDDYEKVLGADNSPVFNRVLDGVFRPGSTFKTITATAGLSEGVITPTSTIFCGKEYTYYAPGFIPTCLGAHGAIPVREGLHHSCNIFFYETARRLGIDKLAEWGAKFGVGKDLGFELAMQKGQMTSLELYKEKGWTWNEGDIVQAGIGQCETLLTPMHLAVQAMTLANKGVRYEPHIVKSVYNYDFTEKLYDKEPVVAEDFSNYPNMELYMNEIREGMKLVASEADVVIRGAYRNPHDFVGIGWKNVAVKTGSPQVTEDIYNAAVIGYYPADDPEIAFAIILERAQYVKVMAANVIEAYAKGEISTEYDENGVPSSPL